MACACHIATRALACPTATRAWIFLVPTEGVCQNPKMANTLTENCSCNDCVGVLAMWQRLIWLKLSLHIHIRKAYNPEEVISAMSDLGATITDQNFDVLYQNLKSRALLLATKSAENNSMFGLFVLGKMTKDLERINRSADMGLDAAQYEMALSCFQTQGQRQDYCKALFYLHKAAEQGYVPAYEQLYLFHLCGRGIPKNPLEAERWKLRAKAAGSTNCD